jgi:hypothetical protein
VRRNHFPWVVRFLAALALVAIPVFGLADAAGQPSQGSSPPPKPAPVPVRATAQTEPPAMPGNAAVYPYPPSGVQVGEGWDSISERGTTASCVAVDAVPLEQASYDTEVQQIQSTYDLATKVTTSVSASYKGFGVGASAAFNSSGETDVHSDDQNFLFTFESEFGSTFAVAAGSADSKQFEVTAQTQALMNAAKGADTQDNILAAIIGRPTHFKGGVISLTPDAAALLKNDPTGGQFLRACGDGFVAAVHRGARIFLLLTQRYASQEQKDVLAASLSASGYGAAASASYSASSSTSTKLNTLTYRSFQQGGVPSAPKALSPGATGSFDVNTILPTADQLTSNPTAFQVVVVPYSDLGSVNVGSSPTALAELGNYYLALNDLWTLVGDILNAEILGLNASGSGPYEERVIDLYGGIQALESVEDSIQADLTILEIAIAHCYSDAGPCTLTSAMQAVVSQGAAAAGHLCANNSSIACTAASNQLSSQVAGIKAALVKAGTVRSITDLDPNFQLRFYSYLAQIPLPRAAYSNSTFGDLQATTTTNQATTAANAVAELKRAVYGFRELPWRNFFCKDQKSATLCVTEDQLHGLADPYIPGSLPNDYFTAVKAGLPPRPLPPCAMPPASPGHPPKNCP